MAKGGAGRTIRPRIKASFCGPIYVRRINSRPRHGAYLQQAIFQNFSRFSSGSIFIHDQSVRPRFSPSWLSATSSITVAAVTTTIARGLFNAAYRLEAPGDAGQFSRQDRCNASGQSIRRGRSNRWIPPHLCGWICGYNQCVIVKPMETHHF